MDLLYYLPHTSGGIFDYAIAQTHALAKVGVKVTVLVPETGDFPVISGVTCRSVLEDETRVIPRSSRLLRRIERSGSIIRNIRRLEKLIKTEKFRHVLFSTYTEYAAPLWAFRLRRFVRSGVRFSAILHDPVRNYVVGPKRWHTWSITEGYSFLRDIFVHEQIDPGEIGIPTGIEVSLIPHGPLAFPGGDDSGSVVRKRLDIPGDAKVLLSFGQIRDGKNLDLVIGALREIPDAWLLVAGKVAGGGNRPVTDYQNLAESSGIANRCRWVTDYIESKDVASYFAAADAILLTYSRAFRSASGVLNAAACFQKPCIASSGAGPLRTQVTKYGLGVWVEPDDQQALKAGIATWLGGIPEPRWEEYRRENSWSRNAEVIRDRLFVQP